MITALHLLDTGYCRASEHHMIRGGARRSVECHALVALLHHQHWGWVLWDTGYAPRLFDATASLPFSLYRRATPLCLRPELAVEAQLAQWDLSPQDIGTVILSHFHADHIAGVRDFPAAQFICTADAYADVANRNGWSALQRAFIPTLLPDDFAARTTIVSEFLGPALPELGRTCDLFGDGSLQLVSLPGHARGQAGLFAPETPVGPTLFVADASYTARGVRENLPAHPLTNLFADDTAAVHATRERLHRFHLARPDVTLLPTHCPEAYARFAVADFQP